MIMICVLFQDTRERQCVSTAVTTHVEFEKQSVIQSATNNDSKCQSCTFEELAIIQEIKKNPAITQREQ